MRRIYVMAAVSALMCAPAAAAPRATDAQSYWYLFGGYDRYNFPGGDLDAGSISIGHVLNRYIGVQGGGQYARKSGVDITNGYAEMLGLLPFGNRFSLFVSVGAAMANQSASVAGPLGTTISVSKSGTGLRTGVGANVWLGPHFGLQVSFHRQNAIAVGNDLGVALAYRF